MSTNYIPAPLEIEFEEFAEQEEFKREFDRSSQIDEDPIGHWLRMAKARGEADDVNTVLLTLLVELHRKVDHLTKLVSGESVKIACLKNFANIEFISFESFKTKENNFTPNAKYYGRLMMPTFPKRSIKVFFEAVTKNEAKIDLMHERDASDWDVYVAARERVMIRKMRGDRR